MWLMIEHTGMSMPMIARHFGKKDHSVVIHAKKAVDNRLEACAQLRAQRDRIEQRLGL